MQFEFPFVRGLRLLALLAGLLALFPSAPTAAQTPPYNIALGGRCDPPKPVREPGHR